MLLNQQAEFDTQISYLSKIFVDSLDKKN